MYISDASSSNEAVHLQQRLRSLSTELVTLRNRLHVQGASASPLKGPATPSTPAAAPLVQPVIPPRNVPVPVPTSLPAADSRNLPPVAGAELEDLIHLQGPLTEDAVMKCLQARFAASNFYVSTEGARLWSLNRADLGQAPVVPARGRPCSRLTVNLTAKHHGCAAAFTYHSIN